MYCRTYGILRALQTVLAKPGRCVRRRTRKHTLKFERDENKAILNCDCKADCCLEDRYCNINSRKRKH
jgi:Cft2 family RNA processing exonuclease